MATSPEAFVRKCSAAEQAYKRAPKIIATTGAAAMKATTLASMRRVAPSGRLRNVGKGARLGVNYKIAGDTAIVKATGPWQLIERDTKRHRIEPKKKRRTGRTAILTPDGPRAYANHPGTHGKHPWRIGVELGKREVKKIASAQTRAPLKALF